MAIFRTNHSKENPYVILNRKSLWDNSASMEAMCLWARMLSRPDDWKTHVNELCKACNVGRDKMRRIVNELIEAGYCYRWKPRHPDGTFLMDHYEFFETKAETEEFKKCLPQTGLPALDEPALANQPLLNTKEEPSKNLNPPPPSSGPMPPTKEEEEEISKRLRERPKDSDPIKNMKKWRECVLGDIRQGQETAQKSTITTEEHRKQAQGRDMQKWQGNTVFACKDRVEFICGSYYKAVRYDVSDDEWKRETGWEN